MRWIQISKNTYINPDKISAITIQTDETGITRISVVAEGRPYAVDKPFRELIGSLVQAGIEVHEDYFAG